MRIVVLDNQIQLRILDLVDNLILLGNKMDVFSRANSKILQSCFNTLYSCNDGTIVARNRESKWGYGSFCKLESLNILYIEGRDVDVDT